MAGEGGNDELCLLHPPINWAHRDKNCAQLFGCADIQILQICTKKGIGYSNTKAWNSNTLNNTPKTHLKSLVQLGPFLWFQLLLTEWLNALLFLCNITFRNTHKNKGCTKDLLNFFFPSLLNDASLLLFHQLPPPIKWHCLLQVCSWL